HPLMSGVSPVGSPGRGAKAPPSHCPVVALQTPDAQASSSLATPGTRPPEPRQSLRAPCWLVSMASVALPPAAAALAKKSALPRLEESPWPKRTTGQPSAGAAPVGTVRMKGTDWITGAVGLSVPL